jgi:hypothetical protein
MRGEVIATVMGFILLGCPALAASSADAPAKRLSRTFSNITPAILACTQTNSRKRYGTTYTPDPGTPNSGMTETHYLGLTKLSFVIDPAAATVTYTIVHKPLIASNTQVWDGIRDAIKACSRTPQRPARLDAPALGRDWLSERQSVLM